MRLSHLAHACALSLLALASSCGGSTNDATGSTSPNGAGASSGAGTGGGVGTCVPGATQPCTGPAQCKGGQTCKDDGSAWGVCDCGGAGGAGGGTSMSCVPGVTQACTGPGACVGAQSCTAAGTSWTACDCGTMGGTGPTGVGGASGTGTGGSPAGGAATGGSSHAGASTGGSSTGGMSNGGMSTGGMSTGGMSTGGMSTGGMSTGGASMGGASGSSGASGSATGGGATSSGPACIQSGGLQPGAPWPMTGRCANRSSRADVSGPRSGTLTWSLQLGQQVGAAFGGSPVVAADGTIYVTGASVGQSALFAVHPSGSVLWTLPGDFHSNGIAIGTDGTLYLSGGGLYAVHTSGPTPSVTTLGSSQLPIMGGSPAIGPDGTIYIGDTAFSAKGAMLWQLMDDGFMTADAIGADGAAVLFAGANLEAVAIDGSVEWSTPLIQSGMGNASIDGNGVVYGAGFDGVHAISTDGSPLWTLLPSPGGNFDGAAIAIAGDGTLYVAAEGLVAITPGGTGSWSYEDPNGDFNMQSPIVDADGYVYATTRQANDVVCLAPDGTLVWSFAIPNGTINARFPPAMGADGTLYVTTGSTLLAFSP